VLTLLLIVAGFAFTQYIVNLHRGTEALLAKRWFTRGNQAMQANLPPTAAQDYRTALTYDPENRQYRLRLAQALLAANRLPEARAHLVSLWEEEPADGEVNLTLARWYARQGNFAEAVRYYGNAINGVWQDEPRRARIAARFELVHYLMQLQKAGQAQAELMALQADGPPDVADQLRLGDLLLHSNEPARAAEVYEIVVAGDHSNARGWLGKGEASLALGNYVEAERAFADALQKDPTLEDARQQLELTREILRIDPALRGLSVSERARRVSEAFNSAFLRLKNCATQSGYNLSGQDAASGRPAGSTAAISSSPATTPAPTDLQRLYDNGLQKQTAATGKALQQNPDTLEPTMQYVFDVERTTTATCPVTEKADRALLTLAQHETEAVK
jgi:tetratricopeptide (TPR) repeat protein